MTAYKRIPVLVRSLARNVASDLTIDEIALRLRVGKRPIDGWLAADLLRAADDRRFQFHSRRGRKRIWTEAAFQQLRAAIERESEPGGVLAASGSRIETATGMRTVPFGSRAVQSACAGVLEYPLRPRQKIARRSNSTRSLTTSR